MRNGRGRILGRRRLAQHKLSTKPVGVIARAAQGNVQDVVGAARVGRCHNLLDRVGLDVERHGLDDGAMTGWAGRRKGAVLGDGTQS